MQYKQLQPRIILVIGLVFLVSISCSLPKLETTVGPTATIPALSDVLMETAAAEPAQESPGSPSPISPAILPTPDPARQLPALRTEPVEYVVQANDTLEYIARSYWIGLNTLISANQIENPELIQPGDTLTIPAPQPIATDPGFKILPDSEVVYGPSSADFDVHSFVTQQNGTLAGYWENVDDASTSGSDIILRVSQDYSVNPRLLLSLLEYNSGWVTGQDTGDETQDYPLGYTNNAYKGLYKQLTWAANEINRGYYLWRVNGIPAWILNDDSLMLPNGTINAGTAGIQYVFSKLLGYQPWLEAVGQNGIFSTYQTLFGYPFGLGYDPLLPSTLTQPVLQLPFEPDQVWRFTGGPHGAFGGGAAWAGLDFAPPGEALGCVQSDAWVVAMADGPITRSGRGQVIQDLDGDGNEQTGWVLLYLHIETRDRITAGTYLYAGDRIGHPSCEGGISTGTHVHIARRYNGEWIPADQDLPFNLEGWISSGTGIAYNGYLTKDGQTVTALTGNHDENQISRE